MDQITQAKKFRGSLYTWYQTAGRTLPWRQTTDPYHILVSEVMLQQTQVDRVLPKYKEFLRTFPRLEDLAKASTADVLRIWSGLGYNSRALRLKGIAEEAVNTFEGKLPSKEEELLSLKGIGKYTAGAIQAFAFHKNVFFIDTNIKRILHRVFVGLEFQGWKKTDKEMEKLAEEVNDNEHCYEYHQALMDLGATICKATKVDCPRCPMRDICVAGQAIRVQPELLSEPRVKYKKTGVPFKESKRYIRGGIVEYLRNQHEVTADILYDFVNTVLRPMERVEFEAILNGLTKDGMVTTDETTVKLG